MSKNSIIVLRIGLALVFLANALTAWLAPSEFKDVVDGSFLVTLFPAISSSFIVTLILINDSLIFLILFFNLKFIIKYALVWASLYLLLVIVITGWSPAEGWALPDILEHLGFLSMAIALFMELGRRPMISQ